MLRALITGINGFVGKYLAKELMGNGYLVSGIGRGDCDLSSVSYYDIDLLNSIALQRTLHEIKPEWVFHLAGIASVQYSWENPDQTFEVNVLGTINLINALKGLNTQGLVFVGSSEVYGPGKFIGEMFSEASPLNPQSPYATSKFAAESVALQLGKKVGLPIIGVRPFNHIGPGQTQGFVVPDFAREIVSAARGDRRIRVGRLDVYRDFTDVRDVVRAYRLLAEKGRPWETYNVCSGEARQLSHIMDYMCEQYGNLQVLLDEAKLRPTENIFSVGDNHKIYDITGWKPTYKLEDSLKDVLAEWQVRLSTE